MRIVGLSRFVIVFVLRPWLQDEPELQPDEEGLVARALGGPVLGAGGAQEEQGWERLGLQSGKTFHIDLVLFVGFFISFSEQAIIAAAGRRLRRRQASSAAGAHVQSNFMSCPPRLSQDLFFCMRYVRKRSFFSLLLAC